MKRLNSFHLRLIALITMTIDHLGYYVYHNLFWMRAVGRIAFPLYIFLMVQAYQHTSSKKRYVMQLCAMGILTVVIQLFFGQYDYPNVMFELAACFMVLYSLDRKQYLFTGILVAVICLAGLEYDLYGLILALFFYYRKDDILMQVGVMFLLNYAYVGLHIWHYTQWYALAAFIPILLYNGKRGYTGMKYFFYLYYPAHLGLLYLLNDIRG